MGRLTIRTSEKITRTAPNLYGIFLEDISRAVDGGLYPELIRNRSFEDSLLPEGCNSVQDGYAFETDWGWRDEFNGGEGLSKWVRNNGIKKTPVPAWYVKDASMVLDHEHTLNSHRKASLCVDFLPDGRLENVGFCGIPQKEGENYHFYMFARAAETVELELFIAKASGEAAGGEEEFPVGKLRIEGDAWKRYDLEYRAGSDGGNLKLVMACPGGGKLGIGFVSLMPLNTFMGHGLRCDIAGKLKGLKPKFFRFPGGCIVEGFTPSTMWRFADTVGPVWERPGKLLMWHYRTYDGVGFHEYLQFCEDLDMEPLYVCNCGMTCQARKSVLLEGSAFDETLEDLMNAIEYAVGDKDTKWGSLRARMGHPEPFRLNYIEIGNENWGEAYEKRYEIFYRAIKDKYPHICCIADSHLEEKGQEVQIVDEHYYDTAEWFAENTEKFDSYDRSGPEIFLGEVAVVRGYVGELYGALGEAAFFTGVERNQDIVTLASYAPLLENVNYQSWFPNLIRFNGRESFGIPSYYIWKLFGSFRGDYVVRAGLESARIARPLKGRLALLGRTGVQFRNPLWNGEVQAVTHEVMGRVRQAGDGFVVRQPDEEQIAESRRHFGAKLDEILVIFGDETRQNGTFEIELFQEKGRELLLGLFPSRMPDTAYISDETNPPAEWNVENVKPILWKSDGKTHVLFEKEGPVTRELARFEESGEVRDGFCRYGYRTDGERLQLYHGAALVGEMALPSFPAQSCVVTDTPESVFIKLVNMAQEETKIEIELDCDVKSAYLAHVFTGKKRAKNSFEDPECVSDRTVELSGAARNFTYVMQGLCVAVLELFKTGGGR